MLERNENERHGILLLDKMATVKSKNLTFTGLVDFGNDDLKAKSFDDKANHGLVFMYQPLDASHAAQPICVLTHKILHQEKHLLFQILSNSVARGLRYYSSYYRELKDSIATAEFCEWINSMFDALNIRKYENGLKPGNKDFLVHQWETLLEEGTITKNGFLTRQTAEGLRVTLRSMMDITLYLTNEFNFPCVLSGNINQDSLEVLNNKYICIFIIYSDILVVFVKQGDLMTILRPQHFYKGNAAHSDNNDGDEGGEYPISLRANYNTMSLWDSRCATCKMTNILNIKDDSIFDDRIETYTYNPFANMMFGYSDKIRIPIQQQDLYTLPYESFLYVEGKLTKKRVIEGANVVLENNCIAFLFDEIRYELNGVEIDRNRNVGITSTLKNYVTVSDKSVILRNASWDAQTTAAGYFNFCVPLYVLLGFCEDYRRVVINAPHGLILI
ncbi:hypothetical protein ALC60_13219 [Trachymyrmex zeteki]|uniref:Uncharacterized protein n=1 Tax=Mycetomoellerius zeteki TaxID=64791 RepID=A0A151WJ74_9HYME|nr:hypothetical protein ALC60_13219 [Trachymyrmex zeteki]